MHRHLLPEKISAPLCRAGNHALRKPSQGSCAQHVAPVAEAPACDAFLAVFFLDGGECSSVAGYASASASASVPILGVTFCCCLLGRHLVRLGRFDFGIGLGGCFVTVIVVIGSVKRRSRPVLSRQGGYPLVSLAGDAIEHFLFRFALERDAYFSFAPSLAG